MPPLQTPVVGQSHHQRNQSTSDMLNRTQGQSLAESCNSDQRRDQSYFRSNPNVALVQQAYGTLPSSLHLAIPSRPPTLGSYVHSTSSSQSDAWECSSARSVQRTALSTRGTFTGTPRFPAQQFTRTLSTEYTDASSNMPIDIAPPPSYASNHVLPDNGYY